jgi:hypothetical protein
MNTSECKLCGQKFWNPEDEEPHCEGCLLARLAWLREPSHELAEVIELRKAKNNGLTLKILRSDKDSSILDSDRSVLDFIQNMYNHPHEFRF